MDKIRIDLGKNSYDILIGEKLLENSAKYISEVVPAKSKLFIVTDSNVAKLYLKKLQEVLKKAGFAVFTTIIPAGEKSKNINQLEKILNDVFKHQPERNSTFIALGGGVVGDITGFAASVLLRGVNFIQIPTTLLAMVDSSVGGKTGINNKFGKNLVGAFYQPKLVLADISLLKKLPKRELLAGYAEVVKYGLICDKPFFEYLEKQKDLSNIRKMIEKSCATKAEVVAADEKEKNIRALLNLGHTFGHALEAICKYDGTLLHGEAVGIGMIMAYRFSEFMGICKKGCADRLEKLLKKNGMKTDATKLKYAVDAKTIIKYMYQDKKVEGNKLTLILAEDIGKCFVKKDVSEKDLSKFLKTIL